MAGVILDLQWTALDRAPYVLNPMNLELELLYREGGVHALV